MKTLIISIITALAVSMAPAATAKDREPPSSKQLPACTGPCERYYTPKAERFLRCAAWRESSFGWTLDGPYGSGAFQMIGSTSRQYAKKLGLDFYAGHRAAEWPRAVQTAVAYAMVNPLPDKPGLEGKQHWSPKWATTIGASTYDCDE